MEDKIKLNIIKQQIDALKKDIEYHNKRYYEQDIPEISDYDYDMLYRELESLEESYPELKSENSPTNKVGGRPKLAMKTVEHDIKMESLHDSFSSQEMLEFINKINLEFKDVEYVVEPKIDGLSVSIEYKNGVLLRASTRGDGNVGEDITENIKAISSIPKKLNKAIEYLEVRGEVYMSQSNFLKLILQQEENGEKLFKNPRNAAAGSLRQKDSTVTAKRGLDIYIFNVQKIVGYEIETHTQSLNLLKSLGLNVIPFHNVYKNSDDIMKEIVRIGNMRSTLDYPLDGAVVKVNSFQQRKILGSTSKFPKWSEAFKYPPEEKITKLLDIEINVGRTGTLTPTGIFTPVEIAGTTVSRATLHNQDFINDKGISIGDTVVLRKAGEIIPEVVRVEAKENNYETYKMPEICPSCGSRVVKIEGQSAIRCENTACPAQLLRHLIHFVSRDAMDIDGLGEQQLKQLIKLKLVETPTDIYRLKEEQLINIDRMGEKSVSNLLSSINKSKNVDLYRLIYALGINHVGLANAKILAEYYENIDNIINATKEDIESISGFGDVLADSIVSYFNLEQTKNLIKDFKNIGINMVSLKKATTNNKFNGYIFVLTGTLSKYKRSEAKNIIESLGGKVSSTVSKNTNYLIAGESSGTKLEKALNLGIDVVSEDDFEKMIEN